MMPVWRHLLVLCLFAAIGESRWLERRNLTIPTVLAAPISVPVSQYWEGGEGNWSSFAMRLGSGPQSQEVRVMASTTWNTLMAINPQGCNDVWKPGYADCEEKRGKIYNHNATGTYETFGIYSVANVQTLKAYGINTSVMIGQDTVTFGFPGSQDVSLPRSVISEIATYIPSLTGLLGLSPQNVNLTDNGGMKAGQPGFLQRLKNSTQIPSLSYGYTAGGQYKAKGVGVYGSLTLGGYDTSRLNYSFQATYPFYEDVEVPLMVKLETVEWNFADRQDTSGNAIISKDLSAHIDSTRPFIYLPADDCATLASQWGLNWTLAPYGGYYILNDTQYTKLKSSRPFLRFNLGPMDSNTNPKSNPSRLSITLPFESLVHHLEYPYIQTPGARLRFVPIRPTNDPRAQVLGRAFLQEAYITVDHERGNFTVAQAVDASKSQQHLVLIRSPGDKTPEQSPAATAAPLSKAAIVGIAVSMAVLIGLLSVILCLFRRTKQHRKRANEEAALAAKEAAMLQSPSSPEAPSDKAIETMELDSAIVHEAGGVATYPRQEIGEPASPAVGEMPDESTLNNHFGGFYKETDNGDGRPIIKVFYEMDASPPASTNNTPTGTLDANNGGTLSSSGTNSSSATTLIGTPLAMGSPLPVGSRPPPVPPIPNQHLQPGSIDRPGDLSPIPQTPLEFYGMAAAPGPAGQRGWIGRAPDMPRVVLTPATPASPTPEERQRNRWLRGHSGRGRARQEG